LADQRFRNCYGSTVAYLNGTLNGAKTFLANRYRVQSDRHLQSSRRSLSGESPVQQDFRALRIAVYLRESDSAIGFLCKFYAQLSLNIIVNLNSSGIGFIPLQA
jgi:hypothetical protein